MLLAETQTNQRSSGETVVVQDKRKTKAQLIVELEELRARVAYLEKQSRTGDSGDTSPSEVADRKKAEAALLSERNRAQQYLDIAGVMFVVLDAKGCVTLINRKGLEILGYGREEDLLGKNWFDTCIPVEVKEGVKAVFAISGRIRGQRGCPGGVLLKATVEDALPAGRGGHRRVCGRRCGGLSTRWSYCRRGRVRCCS